MNVENSFAALCLCKRYVKVQKISIYFKSFDQLNVSLARQKKLKLNFN